ncbi:hypothetical protein PAPYR_13126 [Paratrimastix pyriformis]|uniref:Uncharacterized protein n=1 Tax=Paratrimastix pyriformis TaxID=342808 RepID=A0ABQ8U2B6_9EUKA|nr:hypothetical protein PAPYR_13126 [Paratrimastix pyriformis]
MDLFHSFAHLHHPVWYPSTSVFTLGTSCLPHVPPRLRPFIPPFPLSTGASDSFVISNVDTATSSFAGTATGWTSPMPGSLTRECFRKKPLPPAHFTTGYWNTLHDRIIESPHPYTTNWQTMVSVPNARRQAVDRDDSPPRQPPPSNDRPRLMSTAASLPARLCLVPADPVSRFSFAAHRVLALVPAELGCFAGHPDKEPRKTTASVLDAAAHHDFHTI